MIATRALLPSLALVLGLSACKQEDPSIDSGLPTDKQGSMLTPAEQEQFCDATVAFEAELLTEAEAARAACTLTGVLFSLLMSGGTVDACETVRDGCLDAPEETTGGGEGAACDLGIDWTTCNATIAEIEACREEQARAEAAAFKSLDCAKMEEYKSTPPSSEPAALGEACSRAQAKCPTVLGPEAMP